MPNIIIFQDTTLDLDKFPELIENDDHDYYRDRDSRNYSNN